MNSFLGNLDKIPEYIEECKLLGIKVLRPDINESYARFAVINNNIRFALASIKNIGEGAIESIVEERKINGNYMGLVDFLKRISSEKVNKKCVESLIKAGAFDELEPEFTRYEMLESFEMIMDSLSNEKRNNMLNQINLFSMENTKFSGTTDIAIKKNNRKITKKEILSMEKEMMGLYVSGNPLDEYTEEIAKMSTITTKELNESAMSFNDEEVESVQSFESFDGKKETIAGIITGLKKIFTKSNRQMCFGTIEDLYGSIELIAFPNIYDKYSEVLSEDSIVCIDGKISAKEGEKPKIIIEKVSKLEKINKLYIKIQGVEENSEVNKINEVIDNIKDSLGDVPIYIFFEKTGHVNKLARKWWISPQDDIIEKLFKIYGKDNVKFM